MSGTMRIRFAADMPATVVEILSPDNETIKRVMLGPSSEAQVEVPSEASYIRLRLPSGRNVTIRHPGDLSYLVTRESLKGVVTRNTNLRGMELPKDIKQLRSYHEFRSVLKLTSMGMGVSGLPDDLYEPEAPSTTGDSLAPSGLPGGVRATWESFVPGRRSKDGRELAFSPSPRAEPYRLRISTESATLVVRVPGNVDAAYVRSDALRSGGHMVGLRISTASDAADTVGSYLSRGDYYSAEAMTEWASRAEDMLQSKMVDPWAATVGAYLLLRLRRYDMMRTWARNLAEWFPYPDGCVIWAMQSINERSDGAEAAKYLQEAVNRGLPIYTDGLKLLSQGLRLIGEPGQRALEELSEKIGRVLWTSPFTAVFEGNPSPSEPPPTFEVSYLPPA